MPRPTPRAAHTGLLGLDAIVVVEAGRARGGTGSARRRPGAAGAQRRLWSACARGVLPPLLLQREQASLDDHCRGPRGPLRRVGFKSAAACMQAGGLSFPSASRPGFETDRGLA
jgi:hypothetical protein